MIRVLRPGVEARSPSARTFERAFARSLAPDVRVERVPAQHWLAPIVGPAGERALAEATSGCDFLCPDYQAMSLAPLLAHRRNVVGASVRLLLIAHAPGVWPLEWALLAPLLRPDDRIVVPSHSALAVVQRLAPTLAQLARVIAHPVARLPSTGPAQGGPLVALTRLHPWKLLHRQLDALALLRRAGVSGLRFRIAGPAGDSNYVRALAVQTRRLGLGDCVELVGEIDGDEAKGCFLSGAAMLINLSTTVEESFGKAAAEALGCGVPVLATRWDGLPETVGAAGESVPVVDTGLGMDVDTDRLAQATRRLLDDPPSAEACRAQADRFGPERVRERYRDELEAVLAAPVGAQPQPDRDTPAAPAGGLLATTAPLTKYSWHELFGLHVANAQAQHGRLGAQAPPDASEYDELRDLLISAVRRPLARAMAGLPPGAPSLATGMSESPAPPRDLTRKVAAAVTARATISSRIACLGYLADRRMAPELAAGLAELRGTDGIRSPGARHLDIELLRLEGRSADALALAVDSTDPQPRGELSALVVRQLAMLALEAGAPHLAIGAVRNWLERFPDGPDSGGVWLDRVRLEAARQPPRLDEAVRAHARAQELLGAAAAPRGPAVVKRIEGDRDPDTYRAVLDWLSAISPTPCPRLQDAIAQVDGGWLGVFEYLEASGGQAPGLQDVLRLLALLRACPVVPANRLEDQWLDALARELCGEPVAAGVLDRLRATLPAGAPTLAHGDFSTQNLIPAPALVDWEEMGAAATGFDAGWLLALTRVGAGGSWSYAGLRSALIDAAFPDANLRWFEQLGLLRMLYRARTGPTPEPLRQLVVATVRPLLGNVRSGRGIGPQRR